MNTPYMAGSLHLGRTLAGNQASEHQTAIITFHSTASPAVQHALHSIMSAEIALRKRV